MRPLIVASCVIPLSDESRIIYRSGACVLANHSWWLPIRQGFFLVSFTIELDAEVSTYKAVRLQTYTSK